MSRLNTTWAPNKYIEDLAQLKLSTCFWKEKSFALISLSSYDWHKILYKPFHDRGKLRGKYLPDVFILVKKFIVLYTLNCIIDLNIIGWICFLFEIKIISNNCNKTAQQAYHNSTDRVLQKAVKNCTARTILLNLKTIIHIYI